MDSSLVFTSSGNQSRSQQIEELQKKLELADSLLPSQEVFAQFKGYIQHAREQVNAVAPNIKDVPKGCEVIGMLTPWLDKRNENIAQLELLFNYPDTVPSQELIDMLKKEIEQAFVEGLQLFSELARVTIVAWQRSPEPSVASSEKSISDGGSEIVIEGLEQKLDRKDVQVKILQKALETHIEKIDLLNVDIAKKTEAEEGRESWVKYMEEQVDGLHKKEDELNNALVKCRANEQDLQRQLAASRSENDSLTQTHMRELRGNKEVKIADLKGRLRDAELENSQFVDFNVGLKRNFDLSQKKVARLQEENRRYHEQNTVLVGHYTEFRNELQELTRDLDDHLAMQDYPRSSGNNTSDQAQKNELTPRLKHQCYTLMSKNDSLERDNRVKDQRIFELETQINGLGTPVRDMILESLTLPDSPDSPTERRSLDSELKKELTEVVEGLETEAQENRFQIEGLKAENEDLTGQLQKKTERVEELKTENEELKSQILHYDGVTEALQEKTEQLSELEDYMLGVAEVPEAEDEDEDEDEADDGKDNDKGNEATPAPLPAHESRHGWTDDEWGDMGMLAMAVTLGVCAVAVFMSSLGYREWAFWRQANGLPAERYLASVLGGAYF
ncbi:MAG: hypothetical protein LQ340_005911 [Diploschistes diacapsis]|nr:MAG: hypothetical protein LQ340_005911 [Diploschistes diacapsis]